MFERRRSQGETDSPTICALILTGLAEQMMKSGRISEAKTTYRQANARMNGDLLLNAAVLQSASDVLYSASAGRPKDQRLAFLLLGQAQAKASSAKDSLTRDAMLDTLRLQADRMMSGQEEATRANTLTFITIEQTKGFPITNDVLNTPLHLVASAEPAPEVTVLPKPNKEYGWPEAESDEDGWSGPDVVPEHETDSGLHAIG